MTGKHFSPPNTIEHEPWFPALQRATGNFAFCLQHVRLPHVVAGLSATAGITKDDEE
jgi:hypothetical protein